MTLLQIKEVECSAVAKDISALYIATDSILNFKDTLLRIDSRMASQRQMNKLIPQSGNISVHTDLLYKLCVRCLIILYLGHLGLSNLSTIT